MSKSFVCEECKCSYHHYQSLKRHILKTHPEKTESIKRKFLFKCSDCENQFNQEKNLNFHLRHVHGKSETSLHSKLKCGVCFSLVNKNAMHEHLESDHQIKCEVQLIEFNSYSEFLVWKNETERATKSQFVKNLSSKVANKLLKHYFICHRSGVYTPRGNGKRRLKTKGSVKINAHCPARMVTTVSEDGKCQTKFIKTHVGHKSELGHLFLSSSEREKIAKKIRTKLPFKTILDEVRLSISDSNLERIHLLNKKDLHNITRSFSLNSQAVRDSNDDSRDFSSVEEPADLTCVEESTDLTSVEESTDLESRRIKLKLLLNDFADSITSAEVMNFAENEYKRIKITADAMLASQMHLNDDPLLKQKVTPHNKKSTKKKRTKKTSSVSTPKPAEAQTIALKVLLPSKEEKIAL